MIYQLTSYFCKKNAFVTNKKQNKMYFGKKHLEIFLKKCFLILEAKQAQNLFESNRLTSINGNDIK